MANGQVPQAPAADGGQVIKDAATGIARMAAEQVKVAQMLAQVKPETAEKVGQAAQLLESAAQDLGVAGPAEKAPVPGGNMQSADAAGTAAQPQQLARP